MSYNSAQGNFGGGPGSHWQWNQQGGNKERHRGRGRAHGPPNMNAEYQIYPQQNRSQPQRDQWAHSGGVGYPEHAGPWRTHDRNFRPNQESYQQPNPTYPCQHPYQFASPSPMVRQESGQENTNQRMSVDNQSPQTTSNTPCVTEDSQIEDSAIVYQGSRQPRDNLQNHERDQSPDKRGFKNPGETGHSGRHFEKDSNHKRDQSLDRNSSHHHEQNYQSPPQRNERNKEYQTPDRRYYRDGNGYYGYDHGNRSGGKYQRENHRGGGYYNERGFRGVRSPDSNQGNSSDCLSPQSDGPSPRRRLRDKDPVIHLSKSLSFILRHGAKKQGLEMMPGGFLYVEDILKIKDLQWYGVEDVEYVVKSNDKQRFALEKEAKTGKLKIRANQGHSIEVEGLELTPILKAEDAPLVIHGTYHKSWDIIKQMGLNKMGRNHIHFAAGEPGESGVISGMRSTCEVIITINLEKALKDGIKFFRSANNVILSPGDEKGYIYPCYFDSAVNRSPYQKLEFNANVTSEDVGSKIPGLHSNEGGKKKRKKQKSHQKERRHDHETKEKKDIVKDSPEDLISEVSILSDEPVKEYWDEEPVEKGATNAVDVTESEPQTDVKGEEKDDEEAGANQKEFMRQPSGEEIKTKHEMSTVEISEPDCCISAVDFLKKRKAVAIYCHISDEKLKNIICVGDECAYDFKLNDNLMTEGGLQTFFSEKQPLKIFHGIAWPAKVLLDEYDILLDGTDVSDTKILYSNVSVIGDVSLQDLKALNFDERDWPSWDGNADIFVERCQVMLKAHDLMLSWLKNKLPKKDIFEEAERLVDRRKYEEAKKEKKARKTPKKNKKKS